jgi:hypothetical protein
MRSWKRKTRYRKKILHRHILLQLDQLITQRRIEYWEIPHAITVLSKKFRWSPSTEHRLTNKYARRDLSSILKLSELLLYFSEKDDNDEIVESHQKKVQ